MKIEVYTHGGIEALATLKAIDGCKVTGRKGHDLQLIGMKPLKEGLDLSEHLNFEVRIEYDDEDHMVIYRFCNLRIDSKDDLYAIESSSGVLRAHAQIKIEMT